MGVSEDGDGGGIGADYSVGTIVWVRRRNGSWWPGRILGPEELSVSHLMSPRSGTPVKLLGREDASVDWYNLEKSKRVKAFRCGEFDGCIEKAEASLGVPVKKREKYARREDAILHALELERKQNEMKQEKQGIISDGIAANILGIPKGELTDLSSSQTVIRNEESSMHGKCSIQKSPTLPRNADLLDEEENVNNSSNITVRKDSKQIGQKEGISSTISQENGLQDFCPPISPKKKFLQSVASPNTKRPIENNLDSLPSAVHIVRGKGNASSSNVFMSIKRKRSQLQGGLVEESLVKKRDRCRPLVQVLHSSTKLQASQINHFPGLVTLEEGQDHLGVVHRAIQSRSIHLPLDSVNFADNWGYSSDDVQRPSNQFEMEDCVDHSSFVEDCTSSEVIKTNGSDSSLADYLESEIEEGDILGDTDQLLASSRPNDRFPSSSHLSEKSPDMENLEMSFSGPYEHSPAEVGVSQWHIKGKRNSRCLVKRPFDIGAEKICASKLDKFDGSEWVTVYGAKGPTLRMAKMESSSDMNAELGLCHIKSEQNRASEEYDLSGDDVLQEQMNGYNGQNYPFVAKAARDLGRSQNSFKNLESDSHLTSVFGWKADELSDRTQIELLEESDEFFDPLYTYFSRGMVYNLFNVDLKVKTSYQGEHVPLVSLMSRFNGKAIIGHPVQAEILEDGSINQYFPGNHTFPDGNTTHQPVWRTARRTAMQRVPRSNPVTSSWENDEAIQSHYSNGGNKCLPNVLFGYSKNQLRPTKKKVFYPHQPPSGNFLKMPHKMVNLPSQKTRTLSSFASEKKLGRANGEAMFARGCNSLGGLVESEGQMPSITCVPAKVAFSRILEAVGRSSPTITFVRLSDAAIIDPS